jgi:nicotinamidase-related amidase
MPENTDLHGMAPHESSVALLLIDVINDLEWPDSELIEPFAREMAEAIAALKARAKQHNIPVVYVNDNFGQWRSDFQSLVDHVLHDGVRGEFLARQLHPQKDDYFVLKPKHSGFFNTTLDILLQYLGTRAVIVTGIAGNICVLFTANDAYMRDLDIWAPADCIVSNTEHDNEQALALMAKVLKADTRSSGEIDFGSLLRDLRGRAEHRDLTTTTSAPSPTRPKE